MSASVIQLVVLDRNKFSLNSAPDQLQAQAAGMVEGYLTRISITEYYKEFFANGICSENPKACEWITETIIKNKAYVDGMIAQHSQNDPYWHQVNLYYLQMLGMTQGYDLRSVEDERFEGIFYHNVCI